MDTRRGFTLVELLATLSVLALVALVVSGASTRLFSSGKTAKSISNLRQIVTAMHMYGNDHDGYFPRGYFYKPGQAEVSYVNELIPYLDEAPSPLRPQRNIFVSPTSALPVPVKAANAFIPMTYSVHGVLCPDTSNDAAQVKRTVVARPSQVILVGDSAQNPSSKNSFCTFKTPEAFYRKGSTKPLDEAIPIGSDSDSNAGLGQLRYRADGKAAVAMVDGHVALMEKGTITYANVIIDR